MDSVVSSDDSCDSEIRNMRKQLSEYGMEEENLTKEEMADLIKAFSNSKETSLEDELLRQKTEEPTEPSPKKSLKRRYINVRDRRLPWSLLPSTITQTEKAQALAVYIKLMSINSYRQARQSFNFMSWPPPLQIVEETSRVQPLRSTRSGRAVPVYEAFDDDSSDLDFIVTKPKKRKVSNSESNNCTTYSNKTISLKRKPSKDENARPVKEAKIAEDVKPEATVSKSVMKSIYTSIEEC